jgi:hypothetical protein
MSDAAKGLSGAVHAGHKLAGLLIGGSALASTVVVGASVGVAAAAALAGAIACYIPGFASKPRLSNGNSKGTCSATDALVMVVAEEGARRCVAYFFADRDVAEEIAGKWKITSRIMFDITDRSELTELELWGPAMPYNTIRAAAQLFQQALLAGPCGICLEDAVVTSTMQCCQREDSSNRICVKCLQHTRSVLGMCPFCRAPLLPDSGRRSSRRPST